MDRCWILPTYFSGVGFFISFCWCSWDYCLPTSSSEIPLNRSFMLQSIEHGPQFGFVAKWKICLVTNLHMGLVALISAFSAQDFWKFFIKLLIYVFHPCVLNLPISRLWKNMSKAWRNQSQHSELSPCIVPVIPSAEGNRAGQEQLFLGNLFCLFPFFLASLLFRAASVTGHCIWPETSSKLFPLSKILYGAAFYFFFF